jgi:hypothetical protein
VINISTKILQQSTPIVRGVRDARGGQFFADAKFSTTLPEIPLEYAGLRVGGPVGAVAVSKADLE